MLDILGPELRPTIELFSQELLNQAMSAQAEGNLTEAWELYNAILGIHFDNPTVLYLTAEVALKTGKFGLAINLLSRCVELKPDFSEAWLNLGASLRNEYHVTQSRIALLKSLELKPTPQVYTNLSSLGADSGNPREALMWLNKAEALDAGSADIHWNKSLAHLSLAEWDPGWKLYQYRKQLKKDIRGQLWYPRDKIDAIEVSSIDDIRKAKRLYIHGEQGVGDEIMFMSCFSDMLRDCFGAVYVECERRLERLFSRSWPSVTGWFTGQDQAVKSGIKFDYKVSMGDLPMLYRKRNEDFNGASYLVPRLKQSLDFKKKLAALGPRPWIGMAWLGGTKVTRTHERSIPLGQWTPIQAGRTCVSLQYSPLGDQGADEIGLPRFNGASNGTDIDAQAALVEALDIVVTVTQTVYHIAGALGKRCIVLCPSSPDWRMGMQSDEFSRFDKLPWYQSLTVIRKKADESWQTPLDVAAEIIEGMQCV
ncbi:MAG: hypothetical protein ACRD5H_01940 [Nitrososphaerales archaeon]